MLWLVVLVCGGGGGGVTIDDVRQLDTSASLNSGQLQTCLYYRPGYLTNHQTLFGAGRERIIFVSWESGSAIAGFKEIEGW